MAEILIAATQLGVATAPASDVFVKGDIMVVKDDAWPWGAGEALPKFVLLKVPGVAASTVLNYIDQWNLVPVFTVTSHDVTTDTYVVKLTNSLPGTSGGANITSAQVTAFLASWNMTVTATATNEVDFTAVISQVLQSVAMWGGLAQQATFTETAYDSATGTHSMSVDYSALKVTDAQASAFLTHHGATVLTATGGTATFTITTAVVQAAFLADVKQSVSGVRHLLRRYAFPTTDVDTAVAAGGIVTLTAAVAQSHLIDKTTL